LRMTPARVAGTAAGPVASELERLLASADIAVDSAS